MMRPEGAQDCVLIRSLVTVDCNQAALQVYPKLT